MVTRVVHGSRALSALGRIVYFGEITTKPVASIAYDRLQL
jgi:hypothetical protein